MDGGDLHEAVTDEGTSTCRPAQRDTPRRRHDIEARSQSICTTAPVRHLLPHTTYLNTLSLVRSHDASITPRRAMSTTVRQKANPPPHKEESAGIIERRVTSLSVISGMCQDQWKSDRTRVCGDHWYHEERKRREGGKFWAWLWGIEEGSVRSDG